jgi:hypothetical protein
MAPEDGGMVAANQRGRSSPQGSWEDFLTLLAERTIWKLLVRGLGAVLPDVEVTTGSVSFAERASMAGVPVFRDGDSGFGLLLRGGPEGLERPARPPRPQRKIYVQNRSVGIVISGPSAVLGTRVVDAAGLLRYARRITFETLFVGADESSVIPAVRAARAVENVILLDAGAGVGLCAEVDPLARSVSCPLFVLFGARSPEAVRAYASGGWAAQAVRSQT